MGMQETVAMALAHSLSCGLALIDDVALSSVRETLLSNAALGMSADSPELKAANLLGHLIRLANDGKIRVSQMENQNHIIKTCGRISSRMERDMALGLDDPHDELAVESLRLMREDEKSWFEGLSDESEGESKVSKHRNDKPLPLVLFVRADSSMSLLKSKSAVERLAKECMGEDSIHLLMLGKGVDATTVSLPQRNVPSRQSVSSQASAVHLNSQPNAKNISPFLPRGSVPFSQQFRPNPENNPFTNFSNMPPGMMIPGLMGSSSKTGFAQQNINASGINDPEGSRRFNIFLARTVDKDGNPGIMGAIAPPQAGNLFPQMLAFQAQKNMMQSQANGDSLEQQRQHQAVMQRWAELMNQQSKENNGSPSSLPPPQFFNASIGSPWGLSGDGMGGDTGNNISPPPEIIQRAIQQAVSQVMEQLTELSSNRGKDGTSSPSAGSLPPHLAKAFAQILQNENLRRGIAENLARAAPALIDPRCQGVMLSVYVPPVSLHHRHAVHSCN